MIYLDNAATTRPYDSVIARMAEVLGEAYGNPSSLHRMGMEAENIITEARKTVADSIGAKENEIYFTPSGTLANNTAILGYLRRNKHKGNKVLISSVEHASVYNIGKYLLENGYTVEWIPILNGEPDWIWLEEHLDTDTALVSMMAVNNETGTVFDIPRLKNMIDRKGLKTVLHSDCIQAYGKLNISVRDFGADMMSFSGHKIGAPKGIGVLYVKKGVLLEPLYLGGGQENNLFSGTENVANIAGFSEAVKVFRKEKPVEKVKALSKLFLETLLPEIPLNSKHSLGTVVNISMNLRSEIVLHMLESEGIYVSSGSACSQKKGGSNRVLEGFSVPKKQQDTAIRISFSHLNTEDEVRYAAEKLNEIYLQNKKK
ncbi:MAG: cysteine desulfurase [Clostridia bacterium]|nr:cysteine desulfurase [Clostridia bacterium]